MLCGFNSQSLTAARVPKLLPHEWLCGLFYLLLWARFVQIGKGFAIEAWILLGFFAIHAASCIFMSLENDLRCRLRLILCALLMNTSYFVLESAVPKLDAALEDAFLQGIDAWLAGKTLAIQFEQWTHPVLTEIFSVCYFWYLPYLFSSQARYLWESRELAKAFYTGLFTVYAVGYFGYSTMPGLGPYLAMGDQFTRPLEGWWMTDLTALIVRAASNRVDLFPSLHVANSLFILLFDFHYQPRRFWRCLAPCIGLFISTLYLRYHYLIDVIAGIALSLIALGIALRYHEGARKS